VTVKIGAHALAGRVLLAPMVGITDRVHRALCRRHGAALTFTEMTVARPDLLGHRRTARRRERHGEAGLHAVQLVGAEPGWLAEAARVNEALGADLIDINMGCPAKKVCRRAAGSALLADPPLVARILEAVVAAVRVPVTLKIRTGPHPGERNAPAIARIAAACGVAALTVHGRTRADGFRGAAEYTTIAAVKAAVDIPVIANGDITTPEIARRVLADTGADAVMIGRGSQGDPFIFGRVQAALDGRSFREPSRAERIATLREHVEGIHALYGAAAGARIARKHLGWYLAREAGSAGLSARVLRMDDAARQLAALDAWALEHDRLAA
jgi:tRNA-dihydrouridine synthase B